MSRQSVATLETETTSDKEYGRTAFTGSVRPLFHSLVRVNRLRTLL
jgi:hypothetical protein